MRKRLTTLSKIWYNLSVLLGILLLLVLLLLYGNRSLSETRSDSPTKGTKIEQIIALYYSQVNVGLIDKVIQYPALNDEDSLFVEIHEQGNMDSSLYFIQFSDSGDEPFIERTAASGLERFFEVDLIEISQGAFIAAYCSSHMGNGTLSLIPVNDYKKTKYTFPAIGFYSGENEWLSQNNFLELYGDSASSYMSGHLSAFYEDVSGDGLTDVILSGVQELRYSKDDGAYLLGEIMEYYYCKYVFLYDAVSDSFYLDEELSLHQKIQVD